MPARYKVHSFAPTSVQVSATDNDGVKVVATAPAIVVELTPLDPWRPTITHIDRVADADAAAAAAKKFQIGAVLEMGDWKFVSAGEKK